MDTVIVLFQSLRKIWLSHFLGQILVRAYTINLYVKIQSFALFPENDFPHEVAPALVRLLNHFARFVYDVDPDWDH